MKIYPKHEKDNAPRLNQCRLFARGVMFYHNLVKALQDLAKAVENNPTVKSVKVTVTLQKPKPNKANEPKSE